VSIALFHYNGLGDHVLAWPAVRALASHRPVTLLEGPGSHHVLYSDVGFAARGEFQFWDAADHWIDVAASLPSAGRCNTFLSMAGWLNRTVLELAHGMGAAETIGFHPHFDRSVPYAPGRHMFHNYFELCRTLVPEARFEDYAGPPVYSAAASAAAAELRAAFVGPGEKLLFVHPETKPEKQWSPEGFDAVLEAILTARPEYKALVVSRGNYPIRTGTRVRACDAHLELALALLAEADLFLGVDSVFLHAADLGRVPSTGLFAREFDPAVWGFALAPRARHLSIERLAPSTVVEALLDLATEA
jgi:ADP-heptose:LPS heptosyltransferase